MHHSEPSLTLIQESTTQYLNHYRQFCTPIAFLAQTVERWPFKPMVVGSIPTEGVFFGSTVTNFYEAVYTVCFSQACQYGRVVKAPDLKSGGLCPRRFESCCWRASIVQWLEYLPSKQVARVRFPVDAFLYMFLIWFSNTKKYGHYRAWTGDPWLIRPMLYQLS